jgi:hypothetical protein
MSTKSAVTSLRSPSGMKPESAARVMATPGADLAVETEPIAAPHSLQKRDPGGLKRPQPGHLIAIHYRIGSKISLSRRYRHRTWYTALSRTPPLYPLRVARNVDRAESPDSANLSIRI